MRMTLYSLVALLLTLPLAAQTPTPTLKASTRLVVLDVTITDSHGTPIHNLPKSAFRLNESKHPQTILSFEEHSAPSNAGANEAAPKLQPGVFTNVAGTSSQSTPTILLLDYLNTPKDSQPFVRKEMLDYLRTAPPNRRIAIFGLNSKLIQLQRFTDDPALLRAAVAQSKTHTATIENQDSDPDSMDQQLSSQISAQAIAASAADTATDSPTPPSSLTTAGASFDLFFATGLNVNESQRASMTLQAFHQLAVYLAQIPGRKNLIWFSGAFPLSLQPAGDVVVPYNGEPEWKALYRETVDILTRSRVAVYPVDGRGLMLQSSVISDETQAAMYEMADDTGGKAFINTNGFAHAVAEVIDTGSDYYTIAYDPTEKDSHGEFRSIRLTLEDLKGYKLSYRRGYFADLPGKPAPSSAHLSPVQIAAAYMSPTSSQIPLYARVLPVAAAPDPSAEATLVPARHDVDPTPTRRISVEYSADLLNLTTPSTPDGLHHAHLEYIALAYDAQGSVVGSDVKRVSIAWNAAQYASAMQHGVRYQQEISVPGGAGPTSLRLVLHDLSSDHLGSLDINLTAIK